MKQKDIALIVTVVIVSAIISVVTSNLLISTPKNRQAKVEVVEAIDGSFKEPSKKYFNKDSVNSAQSIIIGPGSNQNPLG